MVILDDLKNLKIYKKKFFLPIDENDKKHNSLILLLTPNSKSSIDLLKSGIFINRRYFESYYFEKNVIRYINSEGYALPENNRIVISETALNEATNTSEKVELVVVDDKARVLVEINEKTKSINIPFVNKSKSEKEDVVLYRLFETYGIQKELISKATKLYDFTYTYSDDNIILAYTYILKYNLDIKSTDKDIKYAYCDVNRILNLSDKYLVSPELRRLVSQFGNSKTSDDFIPIQSVKSNVIYSGLKYDINEVKRFINMNTLKDLFGRCGVIYPTYDINVTVSHDIYVYMDKRNFNILAPSTFRKKYKNQKYTDYCKCTMIKYIYHTVNQGVIDTICNPLSIYKSGNFNEELDDKSLTNEIYELMRIFRYIDRKYGNRELVRIVKFNDIKAVYNYAKEYYGNEMSNDRTIQDIMSSLTEAELSSEEIAKDPSLAIKSMTNRLKRITKYKLNKIKRDVKRGNTGTETRTKTDLDKINGGDVVQDINDAISKMPGSKGSGQSAPATAPSENALSKYDLDILEDNQYIKVDNTLFLFEDAIYNKKIKDAIYADRIKNSKEVLMHYKNIKYNVGFIKYTFTNFDKYTNRNIFVDLFNYIESFSNYLNNSNGSSLLNIKVYKDFISRLVLDSRYSNYSKKTIFISANDWGDDYSDINIKDYSKRKIKNNELNPIYLIYNIILKDRLLFKSLFKGFTLVFINEKNNTYFKIDVDKVDIKKDGILRKFIFNINKIKSNDVIPDTEPDEDTRTMDKKASALNIVGDIEDNSNIEIKSVKSIMDIKVSNNDDTVEDNKNDNITIDNKNNIKVSTDVNKDDKEQNTTNDDKPVTITNSLTAEKNKDNKKKEELDNKVVEKIVDKVNDTDNEEDAKDELDKDDEFKKIIEDLNSSSPNSVKIDNARASRILQLSDQFREKVISGKNVGDLMKANDNAAAPLPATKLPVSSIDNTWDNMTFINFDKEYTPDSDIVRMLDSMKDWSYPISVLDIDVKDTSTSEDYVETWTINLEDYKGKRFTLKLDVPIFVNDKYLVLRGNKKAVMIQSVMMPILKTSDNDCQIIGIGGYNKLFIHRYGSTIGKSNQIVDRIFKILKIIEGESKEIKITYGNNLKICNKYELPIDYIDMATYFTTIETPVEVFMFNQDTLRYIVKDIDESKIAIGYNKKDNTPIYADIKENKMVSGDIYIRLLAYKSFSDVAADIAPSTKKYMYTRAKIVNIHIPVVVICAYHIGLIDTLKRANIKYSFSKTLPKFVKQDVYQDYIQFSDGYLVFDINYESSLLMNGLKECDTLSYSIRDLNNKEMYLGFITEFGGSLKSDGLENAYDCMIDPITKDILKIYGLPTDYVSLLIYSNLLLSDNKFIKHTDLSARRFRRKEIIAGYFYKAITSSYQTYANQIRHTRKNVAMTVKQSDVIDLILSKDPSTGDLSINNVLGDIESANTVTSKGLVGMNLDRAYSLDKRGFDDSMTNVLGMSTGFSATVGVNRQATMNASIVGIRGFVVPGNPDNDSDANTLTATEAMTPFGSTHDDTFRTLMTHIQTSKHMVRTLNTDPMLVTNGADEAIPYLASDIFAYKAKGNGEVVEVTDKYMVIQYKDGQFEYINLDTTIEKNSDGGYEVPLKLSTDLKVGSKFKENTILAYDKLSFSNGIGESGNLSMNVGTLAKIAVMNIDEGFEDSAACTEKFAKKMATEVVVKKEIILDKDDNIQINKKIGDQVIEGDVLLTFQKSVDDELANSLLRNLSMDTDQLSELGKAPVISKYTGTIADIKVYRTAELDELSPSLKSLVKNYEKRINSVKSVYKKYGIETNKLPSTSKMSNTGKTKNVEDGVLIIFFIKYIDNVSIGDKCVFYSANKGVFKYIIPEGKEPNTDFRPNEDIDAFMSLGSVFGRMVCSTQLYGSISKLMVELDRSCKDIAGVKYDDSHV